jgi:lipopolysaccharide/colanic/teichoic acid biosynthesis glycosyltransferase
MPNVTQEAETSPQQSPREQYKEGHFERHSRRFPRHAVRNHPRCVAATPGGWSLSMERRCSDFVVSFLVLIAAFIPGLLVYLLIRATSKGPVLLRQQRVGYGGRLFRLYKFRTI